jgi:hypothetical protein
MKNSRYLGAVTTAAVMAISISMPTLAGGGGGQAKPDLRVSAINTPGGLCKGNTNKVQATIHNNSQLAGVNTTIPVWLRVKNSQYGTDSIYESVAKPIGPNGSQPAWFQNVDIPKTGAYQLIVTADPGNNIPEANESNNALTITRSVQTICGQATPTPATYTLTIKVFEHGTWQGGQGQWISGATVTLTQQYDSSFPAQTKTTNASGVATFTVPGGKLYSFSTQKAGCAQVQSSPSTAGSTGTYQMGTYNATRYLSLDCQQ